MKKGVYYFLFAAVVVGSLMIYYKLERDRKLKNPSITDLAVEPDVLMSTADRTFHDKKEQAAIKFLDDAIETMRLLENDGDSVSAMQRLNLLFMI